MRQIKTSFMMLVAALYFAACGSSETSHPYIDENETFAHIFVSTEHSDGTKQINAYTLYEIDGRSYYFVDENASQETSDVTYAEFETFLNDHFDAYYGGLDDEGNNMDAFLSFVDSNGINLHTLIAHFLKSNEQGVTLQRYMDFVTMLLEIIDDDDDINHVLLTYDDPLFSVKTFMQALSDLNQSTEDLVSVMQAQNMSYDNFHTALVLFDSDPDIESEYEKMRRMLLYFFSQSDKAVLLRDDEEPIPSLEDQITKLGLYVGSYTKGYSWNLMEGHTAKYANTFYAISQAVLEIDKYSKGKGPSEKSAVIRTYSLVNKVFGGYLTEVRFTASSHYQVEHHSIPNTYFIGYSYVAAKITRDVFTVTHHADISITSIKKEVYHDITYYVLTLKVTYTPKALDLIKGGTVTLDITISSEDGVTSIK